MPMRSATPGRKFSSATSAVAASFRAASTPSLVLRSSTTLRLPRPHCRKAGICRSGAPPGGSIFITSAPLSASIMVAMAPPIPRLKSRTRIPSQARADMAAPRRRSSGGATLVPPSRMGSTNHGAVLDPATSVKHRPRDRILLRRSGSDTCLLTSRWVLVRMGSRITIHTIGHSSRPVEDLLADCKAVDAEVLADVRSRPRSRWPQFNQKSLEHSVQTAGLSYVYFGDTLGGHPEGEEFYDGDGRVVYERLADTKQFKLGLKRLKDLAARKRVVVMCAEEDPAKCHRHPLIARYLMQDGFAVSHLRKNGTEDDAAALFGVPTSLQLPLFEPPGEDHTWVSPKRIR